MKYAFWQNGGTPLHDASERGQIEAITLLLQKGANINKVNNVSKITLMKDNKLIEDFKKFAISKKGIGIESQKTMQTS